MKILAMFAALWLQDPADGIKAEDFRTHIVHLASDEMKGRDNDTPEGKKAAEYVAEQMKKIGLEPAGTDGYFHAFAIKRSQGSREHKGVNVAGRLPGSDPKLKDEIIVVNAHHDARGVIKERVQNGADDNASGVAMILELAEALMAIKDRVRRTVVFVSFDAEEDGLLGSRAFVNEKVADPAKTAANVCFDLIGGDFFSWDRNRIYALGSECSPELTELVAKHIAGEKELQVQPASIAVIEPFPGSARSDYANFRKEGIPFVFFSTATPWYYHTEWDDLDIINFPKIEKAGRFCFRFLLELANADKRPAAVKPDPAIRVADLKFLREGLRQIQELGDKIRITDAQKTELAERAKELDGHIEANREDAAAAGAAQRTMVLLFGISGRQNPHRKNE